MPKVPGVTRDLLQKQILELLEGIGIPAKEWIGQGGTKLKRLVTKTGISPFKPNMLGAMSQEKKTFGDALDTFRNEAKFMMNANDQELMNFKNNISDYTNLGGMPGGSGGKGLGSMMKDLEASFKDLEKSAKDLKLSSEEAKAFSKEMMDDALETAKYGGDPFKVPDKKSFGGSMYAEGNMRTALREFLQSEFKNGRLKLNKKDQFRVMNYSPMSEDDPILVYKRIYGDDATKKVEDIVNVFEKGESFKHYEELLRQNVDDQFLKPVNQADVGDGRLVLDESVEIKEKLPDDDDIPFNQGGRVGYRTGGLGLAALYKKLAELLKKKTITVKRGESGTRGSSGGDSFTEYRGKYWTPAEGGFEGAAADARFYSKLGGKEGKPKVLTAELTPEEIIEGKRLRALDVDDPEIGDIILPQSAEDRIKTDHINTIRARIEKMLGMVDYAEGGRVGLVKGSGKKLFNFTKKQLLDAVNDIFPTGDRKYDAEMVSDALVENNPKKFKNRLRQDLNDSEYSEIYGTALDALDAFNAEARELMKGNKEKGLQSLMKLKKIRSLQKDVDEKFGEGTLTRAEDLPEGTKYENLKAVKDFEARNPIEKAKSQGQIWKDEKGETKMIALGGGFSKSEMEGLNQAFIKGNALSNAMKAIGMDPSSSKQTLKFDELVEQGMIGFPAEIREQIIRAKYGDIVDPRLLEQMVTDTDTQHLSVVMGTVDEAMKMHETGMGPEEIMEAIKANMQRKPQALGGGVGSMFRGV